jgi:hypothetical protein
VIPAWTLSLAFVAGLLVGAGVCLLVRRPAPTPQLADAPAEPAPAPTPSEPAPEPEPEPAAASSLATGVDDVVSELERRYKGRKVDPAAEAAPKDRRRQS